MELHSNGSSVRDLLRRCALGALAVLLMLGCLPGGGILGGAVAAFGATEDIEARITEAQRQIEESAAAYEAAQARMGELETQMVDNTERIAQIEEELPQQQQRSDDALRALYKMNREGYSLVDMVLSSTNIMEFVSCIDYLARFQERNIRAIERLGSLQRELGDTRESLQNAIDETARTEQEAADSLAAAQAAREQAQAEAQEQARREREAIEAAKKAAAEEAARKEAERQQTKAEEQQEEAEQPEAAAEEEPAQEQPTETTTDDGANWGDDKSAFVAQWAPRIDGYLSGSALAGTGEIFASAAWDYGVDPRWSPAISAVESSKGGACFQPYNAWGWGSASWGSWEEAINAHVGGLARGYGYTLTEDAARRYCPSGWQHWYDRCAAEMSSI